MEAHPAHNRKALGSIPSSATMTCFICSQMPYCRSLSEALLAGFGIALGLQKATGATAHKLETRLHQACVERWRNVAKGLVR